MVFGFETLRLEFTTRFLREEDNSCSFYLPLVYRLFFGFSFCFLIILGVIYGRFYTFFCVILEATGWAFGELMVLDWMLSVGVLGISNFTGPKSLSAANWFSGTG